MEGGKWFPTTFSRISSSHSQYDEERVQSHLPEKGEGPAWAKGGDGSISRGLMMMTMSVSNQGKGVGGEEVVVDKYDYQQAESATAPTTPDSSSSSVTATLPVPKLRPVPLCCPLSTLPLMLILLTTVLAVTSIIAYYWVRNLGIGLIAAATNVFLIVYCTVRFRQSVLVRQGLATFLETIVIMGPMVILENAWWYSLVLALKLPAEHTGQGCGPCVISSFLDSYTSAGMFEELVKYLALRRVMNLSHVMHPIALVTYGAWAGSAFEIMESLLYYDFSGGNVVSAIYRSITPLHALTGMIMGATLARHRFCAPDSEIGEERWYKTLFIPVVLHGTYDFVDFVVPGGLVAPIIALLIVIFGYIYLRHVINATLLPEHPVEMDVRAALFNNHKHLIQFRKVADDDDSGLPTWRYVLLLLVVLAPIATAMSFLSVGALVPPAYDVQSWADWLRRLAPR